MTHHFDACNGTRYVLAWVAESPCLPEGLAGTCDPPSKKGRKFIYIRDGLDPEEELRVILHETAHAADPRASEEAIDEQSQEQARLLWELGWRPSK